MRGVEAIASAALVLMFAADVLAQTTTSTSARRPNSPELALTLARSAFEYRDFDKVIEFLDPWVHPPQIVDPDMLLEARKLLGISLHLRGRRADAIQEFEEVLLADPEHQLDAFIVPPAVIATFEEVRVAMSSVLEQRRRELEQARQADELVDLGRPHPISAYAPFGLSHFIVLDRPGWGALWLVTQVIALGANLGGYWAAKSLQDDNGFIPASDEGAFKTATAFQFTGLAVFGAAWLGSGIHAHFLLDEYLDRLDAEQATEAAPSSAGFLPASGGIGLRF